MVKVYRVDDAVLDGIELPEKKYNDDREDGASLYTRLTIELIKRVSIRPESSFISDPNYALLSDDDSDLSVAEQYFKIPRKYKSSNSNYGNLMFACDNKHKLLLYMKYETISSENDDELSWLYDGCYFKLMWVLLS